jgi:hypothetical protein
MISLKEKGGKGYYFGYNTHRSKIHDNSIEHRRRMKWTHVGFLGQRKNVYNFI